MKCEILERELTSGYKAEKAKSEGEISGTYADIKPIGKSDFGFMYDQFKHDAKAAVYFLKKEGSGECIGALYHPEVGDIDLVWGYEGTGKSDGFGLSKLLKFHPEVVDNLQEIMSDMHVVSKNENRVILESDKYRAGVRLTWNEESKTWLLTMFEKKSSVSDNTTDTVRTTNGERNDTTTPQNTAISRGKDTNISDSNQNIIKNENKNADIQQYENADIDKGIDDLVRKKDGVYEK